MTNFNSEFNSIFKGSFSIKNYDWNKPRFFDKDNPCYDAEKALMASLTSEAYGKYGFEVDYFVKHISTKRDKLLGEDPLENIERRFHLKVYTVTGSKSAEAVSAPGHVLSRNHHSAGRNRPLQRSLKT